MKASLLEAASSSCSICHSKSRRGSLCACHHDKAKSGKGDERRHPLQAVASPHLVSSGLHTPSQAPTRRAFVSYKDEPGPAGAHELVSAVEEYLLHSGYALVQGAEKSSRQRLSHCREEVPSCDLVVVLLSMEYLSDPDCVAEGKEAAGSGKALLCLHDAKFINLNQALDLGPLAFDLGLDALFRANVRGIHSRDLEGGFEHFHEELQRVLRPKASATRCSSASYKQPQALVSYKGGGGLAGSRAAFLMAKRFLKDRGFKVVQCAETQEPRKPPVELRTALLTSEVAVVIVDESYFADAACRKEARAILDSNLPYFPVHDAKHLTATEALALAGRAGKYDLDAVFDRQIVSLHSQEPGMFGAQWDAALKKIAPHP